MDKTLDELIIDSIEPQIEKIKKKASLGEPLKLQEIYTLLLKTQYNHLSHLDVKLDETVARVDYISNDFNSLKQDFKHLETKTSNDFKRLENKTSNDFKRLETKTSNDFKLLETKLIAKIDQQTISFEYKIQKALNNNTKWTIGLLGALFTAFKIIDILIK